jgi:hypothetical protein
MSRVCLTLARFALSAWVGAAMMLVIIGVREVTWPGFDSTTRDQLALLRFPPYYLLGFALVGTGWLMTVICLISHALPARRTQLALAAVTASLLLMVWDYMAVYGPLEGMVTPPGRTKPAEFAELHERSELVNSIDVGLCLAAAVLLCWPGAEAGDTADVSASRHRETT